MKYSGNTYKLCLALSLSANQVMLIKSRVLRELQITNPDPPATEDELCLFDDFLQDLEPFPLNPLRRASEEAVKVHLPGTNVFILTETCVPSPTHSRSPSPLNGCYSSTGFCFSSKHRPAVSRLRPFRLLIVCHCQQEELKQRLAIITATSAVVRNPSAS